MLNKLRINWRSCAGIVLAAFMASGSSCDQPQNPPQTQTGAIRLSVLGAPASVNPGDELTLKVNTEGAQGAVLYTWTKKSGPELTIPAELPTDSQNSDLIFKAPYLSQCGPSNQLRFRLDAKDAAAQTGSVEIVIGIEGEACQQIKLSVINLPSLVLSGDDVKLQVKSENFRGDVKYTWTQVGDRTIGLSSIPTDNDPNLIFKAPKPPCGKTSNLKLRLTAVDAFGQVGELETGMLLDQAWCTLVELDGLRSNNVTKIALESSGKLWIGTDAGLNSFDGSSWTGVSKGQLYDNNIQALAVNEKDNSVWISSGYTSLGLTYSQLQRFLGTDLNDGSNWKAISLPNSDVRAIAFNLGKIYVGTGSGVSILREDVISVSDFTLIPNKFNDINNEIITSIGFYSNRQWFATGAGKAFSGRGIWAYSSENDPKPWFIDGSNFGGDGISYNRDISTMVFNDPNLYIGLKAGVRNGGMVRAELTGNVRNNVPQANWKRFTTADGLVGNDIRKIVIGDNNQLWVATSSGLSSFDPVAETWKSYKSATVKGSGGFSTDDLVDLAYDKVNNILWIATNGGGVTRLSLNLLK